MKQRLNGGMSLTSNPKKVLSTMMEGDSRSRTVNSTTLFALMFWNMSPRMISLILFYHDDELKYISKDKIKINQFRQINRFFYETLKAGYESFVVELKDYLFQGFEWEDSLIAKKAESIEEITLDLNRINISRERKPTAKIRELFHWLKK